MQALFAEPKDAKALLAPMRSACLDDNKGDKAAFLKSQKTFL